LYILQINKSAENGFKKRLLGKVAICEEYTTKKMHVEWEIDEHL
jgi:hypothetical protein